jgi:hypothetical protein
LRGGAAMFVDSRKSLSFGDQKRPLFLGHGSKLYKKPMNTVDVVTRTGYAKIKMTTPMMQMQMQRKPMTEGICIEAE